MTSEAVVRFGPRGATLAGLSEADYWQAGVRLGNVANGLRWAIGDWLLYGLERQWTRTVDKYHQAQIVTGLSYDTLSQSVRVAGAYSPEERVSGLSWSHHRAALSLHGRPRRTLLARALEDGLTAEQVSRMSAGDSKAIAAAPSPPKQSHRRRWERRTIKCPECGHSWEPR